MCEVVRLKRFEGSETEGGGGYAKTGKVMSKEKRRRWKSETDAKSTN